MKIAIFGGTFDPVHQAHITVAREAANRFALDRVLMIPAGQPPHKINATAAAFEHRLEMVRIAAAEDSRLFPSPIEAGEAKSYSINTIERVAAMLDAGDSLYFLIGADAFAEIKTWHRWSDVVNKVEFIVVTRPGHVYDVPPGARVHRLETLALPVSSSEIRQQLQNGHHPEDLPAEVFHYIQTHNLYGAAAQRAVQS